MAVRLWATLPKDNESNGLTALERPILDDPDGPYYIVAEVNGKRATVDYDGDETIPTIRVMHGEALFGDLAKVASDLLAKAQVERCGPRRAPAPTLPFGSDGPGDENPGDDTEPDTGAGDLEPAAGSPPFLAAATDDDTDGE